MSKGFNRGYQAGYNDGVAAKAPPPDIFGQNARVTATYMKGDNTVTGYADMTTDLPADALGELVATVINTAWSKGEDPAGAVVVLQFGSVPVTEEINHG